MKTLILALSLFSMMACETIVVQRDLPVDKQSTQNLGSQESKATGSTAATTTTTDQDSNVQVNVAADAGSDAGSTSVDAGSDSMDSSTDLGQDATSSVDGGADSSTDAGATDSGSSQDAGTVDVGTPDANAIDAGTDSGVDASSLDAGNDSATDIDVGQVDAGTIDAAQDATSSVDAGNPDFECSSDDDCNKGLPCTKFSCVSYQTPHPGSLCALANYPEICDGKDNDCDGITDNVIDPQYLQTYYEDKDGDAFGNPNKPIKACSKPAGYVVIVNNPDCGDNDPLIRPGALERCNNLDDNCDGQTDENVKLVTYYVDEDNDGYGSDKSTIYLPVVLCDNGYQAVPSYYVPNKDDCNNKKAAIHPGAFELCDYIDNDCDGQTDEDFGMIGVACGGPSTGSVNVCSPDGKHTECSPVTCDPAACGLLGGKCDAGVCKSFCDTCTPGSVCEDTNKDGLGDKCSPITSDMLKQIPPYYKDGTVDLENSIIVLFEGLPKLANFWESFQTFAKTSKIGSEWTDEFQWQLDSTWLVIEFYYINGVEAPNEGFKNPNTCGVRFNLGIDFDLNDGKSNSDWMCEGNGSTAAFKFSPRFFVVRKGVGIEVTKLVTPWSAPGGPTAGCSALLPFKSTCPD